MGGKVRDSAFSFAQALTRVPPKNGAFAGFWAPPQFAPLLTVPPTAQQALSSMRPASPCRVAICELEPSRGPRSVGGGPRSFSEVETDALQGRVGLPASGSRRVGSAGPTAMVSDCFCQS